MSKILLYDIETTPNLGYTWDKYEQNVIAFKKEKELLSFAYKWLGDKKVTFCRTYGRGDKDLCKKLHKLFEEADVVVAQNGDKFDQRIVRARMIINKLPPTKALKTVDTMKAARRFFKFNSNSLNDLGQTLGLGRKVQHQGIELWLGCMKGDKKSWKIMEKYNKQDVALLEKVYLRLRPWITNHPDLIGLKGSKYGCPNCASVWVAKHGIYTTRTMKKQRFKCNNCGTTYLGKLE